jgi:amino acid adenylation domain-containing protein
VIAIHHIASDGWSMGVLQRELVALYQAFRAGDPSPLPALSVQYADFAAWQRQWLSGERLEQQLAYWRDQLADAPTLHRLPLDRPRPAEQRFVGERLAFSLDAELTAGLRRTGRAHGATLFMTLLAGFTALLARHAGQTDWVIGTPIANRVRRALEPLIGFFVNTLALRLRWDGDPPWSALLEQVRETALQAYAHQELPFERLVEELNPERSLSHEPLVQILFALQNAPAAGWALEGLEVTRVGLATQATRFELECYLREVDDRLVGLWVFNTDLFAASTIELLQGHFQTLLKSIVANPEQQVSRLPLWDEAERRRVLVEWNRTDTAAPLDQTVVALFEAQAAHTPEATAVVFADQALSYGALNARANRVAHHLLDHAVCHDTHNPLIALCLERSVELVVGLLGILKAGGAYVPLDPAYPAARLAFMLADSGARLMLTHSGLIEQLPLDSEQSVTPVCLDRLDLSDRSDSNPTPTCTSEDLAYVIYTSGSTGKPKGVAMPHRPLANLVNWQLADTTAKPGSRTLQYASFGFDVSFQELFATWAGGGTLVLIDEETRRDPRALLEQIGHQRIERMFIPFVALAQLAQAVDTDPTLSLPLKEIVTAGEQLRIDAPITRLFERFDVRLVNQYGPSESHVVTAFPLPSTTSDWPALPPIGRPIANTQVYVLDAALTPVPIGVPGELCIAGAGLARGYLNRPELTAERFIELPGERLGRADDAPVRLYRTGDLVRWRPDGNLEFLGRIDDQVKIRGFRIELGEIETVLSALPQVTAAAVLAREDRPNDRRLVAYVVLDQHRLATADTLRRALAERLPDYMIPSALVPLDALPLNANGKVDRRALPAPELDRSAASTAYIAPRTPLEETLAELWQEVLMLNDPPGVHDDFFELGGHSLLSAQLLFRIEANLGRNLHLRQFFAHPTIAGLADALESPQSASCALEGAPANAVPGQTGLDPWLHAPELYEQILAYSGSWRGERANPDSLIIGRNTSGTRPPLFWVFQGQQELLQLATYLGEDQPLYGMRSGHLVMKYTEDNIQALALGYLREIEALHPKGPLFVGGNCQGGVIALAIAQHLIRRRRLVPLVVLLEWSFLPQPYAGPVALLFGRESDIANPYARSRYPELTWRRAFPDFHVEILPGAHGQFFIEPNVQVLAETVQCCMAESLNRPQSILPAEARRAEIQVDDPPRELTPRSHYLLGVRVTNPTEVAWPAGQSSGLMLANRWLSTSGELLCELDACVPLPPLAPGETRTVSLPVLSPDASGTVELLATVTQEGVSGHGGEMGTLRLPVSLVNATDVVQSPSPNLHERYGDPILICSETDAGSRGVANLLSAGGVFVLGETGQSDPMGMANAVWLRRLLPYWNKELPDTIRRAVIDDLDEWLHAAFASRKDAKQRKIWGWVNPANALLLPILLDFWPALRVIQVVRDAPETADSRETQQTDMLAAVVLDRDEVVLPPDERSVRIWEHLSSTLAVNAERLMPYNHLQLRLEDLSSDPNATLARVLEFLEHKGSGEGLVSRTKPAQESAHRKRPQVAATQPPINPEQTVSRHLSDPVPNPRAPLPMVSTGSALEERIAQGEEAWHRGNFPTAIGTLGAVAKSTDAILPKLADALFKKGHYGEALLRFRQAVASDETNAELWLGLAQTRLALGQRTEAAADLHLALDLKLLQPVRALEPLMSLQQPGERVHNMLAPVRAALERNPQDIVLLTLAAQIELAAGNGAEARAKAERLSKLVPDRIDLVTPITEKLIAQGWLDEARTLLEPLARDIPGDPEIERLVGLLTAKANDDSGRTAIVAQAVDHLRARFSVNGLPRRSLRFGKRMLKKLRSPSHP